MATTAVVTRNSARAQDIGEATQESGDAQREVHSDGAQALGEVVP